MRSQGRWSCMFRSKPAHIRRRQWKGILFVLPGFLGVMLFYLIPFLDVMRRSFFQMSGNRFCGLDNYRAVLNNQAFRLAARNTIRFVAVCLPLLLVISFVFAVILTGMWRHLRKSRWLAGDEERVADWMGIWKGIYLVPYAIPAASIVALWEMVFAGKGFFNGVLHLFDLSGVDWMNTGYAFWVLVFSYVWKNLGYSIVLWMAGLMTIPQGIYEAAQIDGAGERTILFRITLPMIRPVIFTIVILSFLNSFKVFREAYLVAGNYPQENIYLLQHLFNNWFMDLSVDKMAAGAGILVVVAGALTMLLQRSWEKSCDSKFAG